MSSEDGDFPPTKVRAFYGFYNAYNMKYQRFAYGEAFHC